MYRFLREPRWIIITVLVPILIIAFLMLSRWQWHRYQVRNALNIEIATNAHQSPVPLTNLATPGQPINSANVWRVVTASGTYDEAAQALVRRKTMNSDNGFWVVTPLDTPAGVVLVNRGWLPATGDAQSSPVVPPPPQGKVEVTGVLQDTEHGPAQEASDVPAGQVTNLDTERSGAKSGKPTFVPYLNMTASTPQQAEGLTPIPLPAKDNGPHLSYTLQWIAFSILVVIGWVILVRREARWRREQDEISAQAGEQSGINQESSSSQPAR